jgi:hypothetical protein
MRKDTSFILYDKFYLNFEVHAALQIYDKPIDLMKLMYNAQRRICSIRRLWYFCRTPNLIEER